jgi:hypothetical protein
VVALLAEVRTAIDHALAPYRKQPPEALVRVLSDVLIVAQGYVANDDLETLSRMPALIEEYFANAQAIEGCRVPV